jgi:hypothetical protein
LSRAEYNTVNRNAPSTHPDHLMVRFGFEFSASAAGVTLQKLRRPATQKKRAAVEPLFPFSD